MLDTEYRFRREPTGLHYRNLLEHATGSCSTFSIVVRHSVPISPQGEDVLGQLSPFLISSAEAAEWPGTRLIGHTATLLTYAYGSETAVLLGRVATGLFEWLQPDLPEDLCLCGTDGSVWLATIAHERDAFLRINQSELEHLRSLFPELDALVTT